MDDREATPSSGGTAAAGGPAGGRAAAGAGGRATPRGVVALIHAMARAHAAVYRATGGRLGRRMGGLPVCLLTTRGHRSGRPRSTTLSWFPHGDGVLVVPANAGSGRLPAWYHNLVAEPRVLVQVGRDVRRMTARVAGPDERARLWPQVVAASDVYAQHQGRQQRPIPVVVLEPVG
jgi:deazaflavin-dependent oxidoreductase (nitroreductase family)